MSEAGTARYPTGEAPLSSNPPCRPFSRRAERGTTAPMKTPTVTLPERREFQCTEDWALEDARRLTREILGGTGVRAILYGSRARGEARRFSDIDLALSAGDRPVPGRLIVQLSEAFEESRNPFKVDLLDLFLADGALREAIEREGVPWTD